MICGWNHIETCIWNYKIFIFTSEESAAGHGSINGLTGAGCVGAKHGGGQTMQQVAYGCVGIGTGSPDGQQQQLKKTNYIIVINI